MNEQYMVYVECTTYNQSAYITSALDGFCMQQTSFPFICCIIDDASTDGEQGVLESYLKANFEYDESTSKEETDNFVRIFARHKSNTACYFAVVFLKNNHYQKRIPITPYTKEWQEKAKYTAMCEGDDYWSDPLKLQKQVDFMEDHPSHSLCFCAHQLLFPSGKMTIERRYEKKMELCPMQDIIMGGGGYMATNTMLFRQSLYVPYQTWTPDCPIGDLPMMLSLANKGHVGYLADVMGVYRVSAKGSWTARMASNPTLRNDHHLAIIRMWHQFDDWSNKQYHKIIAKKIRNNRRKHFTAKLKTMCNSLIKCFASTK